MNLAPCSAGGLYFSFTLYSNTNKVIAYTERMRFTPELGRHYLWAYFIGVRAYAKINVKISNTLYKINPFQLEKKRYLENYPDAEAYSQTASLRKRYAARDETPINSPIMSEPKNVVIPNRPRRSLTKFSS